MVFCLHEAVVVEAFHLCLLSRLLFASPLPRFSALRWPLLLAFRPAAGPGLLALILPLVAFVGIVLWTYVEIVGEAGMKE